MTDAMWAAAGVVLGAMVTGLFALIRDVRKNKAAAEEKAWEREAAEDEREREDAEKKLGEGEVVKKALRYIMLFIIQERCMQCIRENEMTLEARRAIHKWHDLYHNGLGGNGDADALMERIDELPLGME